MESIGKALMGLGLIALALGTLLLLLGWFGVARLPGDLVLRRGNFTLYAPVGLMIVLSIVGTIVLNLFFRRR